MRFNNVLLASSYNIYNNYLLTYLHSLYLREVTWRNLVFPLDLLVYLAQVLDELFLLGVSAKHGRHLLFQLCDDVRVDL